MSVTINQRSRTVFLMNLNQSYSVQSTVTSSGYQVHRWIEHTLYIHRHRLPRLIVGLDTEWRPVFFSEDKTFAAVLQLCVGHRCLVFQINQADYIPTSLFQFMANKDFKFVGVGISGDVERLSEDYGISVANVEDLRYMAAKSMGRPELKRAGLARLAMEVMGTEVVKPKKITLSKWHNRFLNLNQIGYATVDAFVSFEIGRKLTVAKFD